MIRTWRQGVKNWLMEARVAIRADLPKAADHPPVVVRARPGQARPSHRLSLRAAAGYPPGPTAAGGPPARPPPGSGRSGAGAGLGAGPGAGLGGGGDRTARHDQSVRADPSPGAGCPAARRDRDPGRRAPHLCRPGRALRAPGGAPRAPRRRPRRSGRGPGREERRERAALPRLPAPAARSTCRSTPPTRSPSSTTSSATPSRR